MSEINQIIAEITDNNLEVEVYKILHNMILESYEKELNYSMEQSASLKAIKKINQGKNKAIDALCEGEQ
jgi:hypothetical protein